MTFGKPVEPSKTPHTDELRKFLAEHFAAHHPDALVKLMLGLIDERIANGPDKEPEPVKTEEERVIVPADPYINTAPGGITKVTK